MSELSVQEVEREEIEMLLPWYVTGKLDLHDLAKVEAYLAAHPQVAAQVDLVRAEREQTLAANEALGALPVGARERLIAALPAVTPFRTAWRTVRQFPQRIGGLFVAPTAGAVRWAAVAAAALIAIETVALAALLSERGPSYRVASGVETGDGVSVLVVFAEEARASAIARLLTDIDASIVDGPKAGGVYKVRLRMEDRSHATREALVQRLAERRDIVRAVLPSRD